MNIFLEPYRILKRVLGEGAFLKIALSEIREKEHGRSVKIIYGVLEHYGEIGRAISSAVQKWPQFSVELIFRIAIFSMDFMDMPRPIAVNEAVNLTKALKMDRLAPFVNAVLRTYDPAKVRLPEGEAGLCLRSNFPLFAVREMMGQYGERADAILTTRSKGLTVRFVRGEEDYLDRPHLDTPFAGVYVFEHFRRDGRFFSGDYTFQSVGSVAVCSVVEPCERLLDACAAPGGKSVLLASKCKKVVACELHPHRTNLIGQYFARMGVENGEVLRADSTVFRPEFEEAFDGVLCDVPCSGFGTASENPDIPLMKDEDYVNALIPVQRAILKNCARYVKKGGCLYYATCSILQRENDDAVAELLEENPDFEPQEISCPLSNERTEFGLQFLPDTAFGAGFYVAKLRRKA